MAASLAAAALPAATLDAAPKSGADRPNIIYIMLDDMPYDMLPHSDRYPFMELPHLERLQKEGATFTNFFCTNSLSSPSRATNLTGVYSHVHGVTQNLSALDPDWDVTKPFSVFMQSAGYNTAFIGKIHMASDAAHKGKGHIRPGFDYWVSFYGQGKYDDPQIVDNGKEIKKKGYMTDILNKYATDWLTSGRDKKKPFVMCLWHKAVHDPFTPADRHANLYSGVKIAPPAYRTDQDDLSDKPKYQRMVYDRDDPKKPLTFLDRRNPKPWDPRRRQQIGQLKTMSAVDDGIGQIMELLEKEGILDNTIIMFSSDNGFFHNEHQKSDKRLAYENSIRIPMVVRYPKAVKAGTIIDAMCLNIDVAPTIVDFGGAAIPEQFQGVSLKGVLAGKADPSWRQSFFYEYFFDNGLKGRVPDLVGIRTQNWKYVYNTLLEGTDIDELYDLQADPGEMKNLFLDKGSASMLKELQKELQTMKELYRYNPDRNWRIKQISPNFKDRFDGKN